MESIPPSRQLFSGGNVWRDGGNNSDTIQNPQTQTGIISSCLLHDDLCRSSLLAERGRHPIARLRRRAVRAQSVAAPLGFLIHRFARRHYLFIIILRPRRAERSFGPAGSATHSPPLFHAVPPPLGEGRQQTRGQDRPIQ
jgi:hypothetical protein